MVVSNLFFTNFEGRELEPEKDKKITKFVKVCMEKYVNRQSKLAQEDVSNKVSSTARRYVVLYCIIVSSN